MHGIKPSKEFPIIGWWSGGSTSAVACKLAIDLWGLDNIRLVFIDTCNEHEDTYRFKKDCEAWYGKPIECITAIGDKYKSIRDVWFRFLSLNVANGAICSAELKRAVRMRFQKENPYSYQVFGYDADEPKRPRAFTMNYPETNPIYTLLMYGMTKQMSIDYLIENEIKPPVAYELGLNNNNCLGTGCVQGGIGYWQHMNIVMPHKYEEMALIEHQLTDLKGSPVTMNKDQSKEAKTSGKFQVFLKPHPDYPDYKDLSMMEGRAPKPLMECNGFCGTNDLMPKNETYEEINYGQAEIDFEKAA